MTSPHAHALPTQVGWVGLGAMGLPMASVLLANEVSLAVFDIAPAAVEQAVQHGATAAASAADAAAGADVLVVMVASPQQLDDVLFGSGAAAAALPEGAVVLVTSTVGPAAVESAATRLSSRGIQVVDAPVSGGVARAGAGDLLFLVSGPGAARSATQGMVDLMARDAFTFGDRPGDGQRVKLVNQLLCGVHIAAAAEALAFAESLGLEPAACYEAIRTGAAASFMLDDRGSRMIEPASEVRSAVSIFVKDLALVTEAGAEHHAITDLAAAALEMFEDGAAAGFARDDDSRLIERLRQRAGLADATSGGAAR